MVKTCAFLCTIINQIYNEASKMKNLLVFLFLLCSASVSAQDVIVKKDGSTVVCRVIEVTQSEITYKKWGKLDGANYVMDKSLAASINYENGRKDNFSEVDNHYEAGNQSDGSREMNDRALLELDAALHPKKKVTVDCNWHIQAGLAMNTMLDGKDLAPTIGYNLGFGATLFFNKKKLFINADAFFASIGCKDNFEYAPGKSLGTLHGNSTGFAPSIGYHFDVNESFSIEPYIGPYIGYAWGIDEYEYEHTLAGYDPWTGAPEYHFYNYGFSVDSFLFGINAGSRFNVSSSLFFELNLKYALLSDGFEQYNSGEYGHHIKTGPSPLNVTLGVGLRF